MADRYTGSYIRFETQGEQAATALMGADNLVGDRYSIDVRDEGDKHRAVLVNRFGADVGYLDARGVRDVQLAQARGWQTVALLSYVAFTQGTGEDNPSHYWGEMAVIAYDPKISEPMEVFLDELSKRMADGARPQVDFGEQAVEQLVSSGGTWFPSDRAPRPKLQKGSSLIKDHRTPNERLIEQSRKGNIGCYIAGYAFIGILLALVIFAINGLFLHLF